MIRLVVPLLALCALLLAGLILLVMGYRLASLDRQLRIKAAWSKALLKLCGIKVRVIGEIQKIPRRSLIVLNHISWLDIFIVNACMPGTFIAKSEIRSWPFVGWLVAGAGTLFVERKSRRGLRRVNHEIHKRLDRGERIVFFPEGTTSVGSQVLPFRSGLFANATDQSNGEDHSRQTLAIAPMALRFFEQGKPTEKAAYVGNQTLVGSVFRILSAKGLTAELEILEPIMPSDEPRSRQVLALMAQKKIADALLASR